MKYSVDTIRAAGLQARWTKTRYGAPIIAARERDGDDWYVVDATMWRDAERLGILESFRSRTALGEFFSISA